MTIFAWPLTHIFLWTYSPIYSMCIKFDVVEYSQLYFFFSRFKLLIFFRAFRFLAGESYDEFGKTKKWVDEALKIQLMWMKVGSGILNFQIHINAIVRLIFQYILEQVVQLNLLHQKWIYRQNFKMITAMIHMCIEKSHILYRKNKRKKQTRKWNSNIERNVYSTIQFVFV